MALKELAHGSSVIRNIIFLSFSFRQSFRSYTLLSSYGFSVIPKSAEWTGGPKYTCVRYKSSHIRIANRKKVEMFIGQRFHVPTRLRNAAPDIAAEWDFHKNPGHLYPAIVGVGCMELVWWRCHRCHFSFSMSPEKRVVRGGGCPKCRVEEQQGQKSEEGLVNSNPFDNVFQRETGSTMKQQDEKTVSITPDSGFTISVNPVGQQSIGLPEVTKEEDSKDDDKKEFLQGEKDMSLRVKRPPMLTNRSKY